MELRHVRAEGVQIAPCTRLCSDDVLKRLVPCLRKKHVCTRLYHLSEEGCGEPCFMTCWTSHGDGRGQSERQFDGCDCFGSHAALLTSAGPQMRKLPELVLDSTRWPHLATGWPRWGIDRARASTTTAYAAS